MTAVEQELLRQVDEWKEIAKRAEAGLLSLRTEYVRRMLNVARTPMEDLWREIVNELDALLSRLQSERGEG